MVTHYEVLGIGADASPEDIREAYRRLARDLHPDRGAVDPRRMQQVNEAYRVLHDPARRAAYDDALRPPAPPRGDEHDHDGEDELVPGAHPLARSFPWLVLAVVLGTIFVFTAFAARDEGDPKQELVGQCVVLGGGSSLTTTPCDRRSDGKVVLVVDRPSHCPDGSDARSVDDRWLCLAAP